MFGNRHQLWSAYAIGNGNGQILGGNLPAMDQVRMVNSGTEATMSALRLARAYTKRDKIVKLKVVITAMPIPTHQGRLRCPHFGRTNQSRCSRQYCRQHYYRTIYDLPTLEEIFRLEGENIAAVILEPVAGNMGCVPPEPGFLTGLRELTQQYGALLIFDEVITGFL